VAIAGNFRETPLEAAESRGLVAFGIVLWERFFCLWILPQPKPFGSASCFWTNPKPLEAEPKARSTVVYINLTSG
jgi:hypothetical protein